MVVMSLHSSAQCPVLSVFSFTLILHKLPRVETKLFYKSKLGDVIEEQYIRPFSWAFVRFFLFITSKVSCLEM